MATTKIWAVKERLRQLIEYVCDLDKTTENETSEALKNLIWYDADESKTEQRLYVTGIGCTPENALSVMNKNLSTYPTNSDRVAYHAYQSFAEDEVDPKTAHAIGIAFANGHIFIMITDFMTEFGNAFNFIRLVAFGHHAEIIRGPNA